MERKSIHDTGTVQGVGFRPFVNQLADISVCPDCLRELFDPQDRRYGYPFINCTNCGPRFTIIRDTPYDRALTTMAAFEMCQDCAREYRDPLSRRFQAPPVACPKCGPKVWLEGHSVRVWGDEAFRQTRQLLARGSIVAIKGLGGFDLACDATNDRTVEMLRNRKGRVDKPFAVMALDAAAVEKFCYLSDDEKSLLESRARPIVLLRRRPDAPISEAVAPNNNHLGVMLPYTPLHYWLFAGAGPSHTALVMTSGNVSEEPIATDNAEALERLAARADYFLLHDREIRTRADDSVTRVFENRKLPVRRSRGYAPSPIDLPFETRPVLAAGADSKNTFCLTRERYAFLSQHIGDLENDATLQSYRTQIEHLRRLLRVEPECIAYDLHPNYLSARYAQDLGTRAHLRAAGVQHHHAHIAACMAENGLTDDQPAIGVAFDGAGYGSDGKIWGGEFLLARYSEFKRLAHLANVRLPGGDVAIRRVYRSALAHLHHAGIPWDPGLPCVAVSGEAEQQALRQQLETGLNAPETSSIGRLFDAVAALIGVREVINYEAQAAIELEQWVVEDLEATYAWKLPSKFELPLAVDPAPVIQAIVYDYRRQVPPWVIATKFHNAVADLAGQVAALLRESTGVNRVALSGGVWQNVNLLGRAVAVLRGAGFEIYLHRRVPPNDGGISLGQAAVAAHALK